MFSDSGRKAVTLPMAAMYVGVSATGVGAVSQSPPVLAASSSAILVARCSISTKTRVTS